MTEDKIQQIKPDLSKDIEFLNMMKGIEKTKKMHSMKIGKKTIVSHSSRLKLEENVKKMNKIYKSDL